MSETKDYIINTLGEYIEYIEAQCSPDREMILFRGQCIDKPLLPKFARRELGLKRIAIDLEKIMLNDFKTRGRPYLKIEPQSEWDWLALAQHHGLPTRLLDWTKNPLAALWFAVREPAKDINGVIWLLDVKPEYLANVKDNPDPFDIYQTKIFQPTHISERFIQQDGWFTVNKTRIVSLEDDEEYKSQLTKLKIPARNFANIRKHLDRCGINDAHLFPDMDGLCKHILWVNSRLEDEVV